MHDSIRLRLSTRQFEMDTQNQVHKTYNVHIPLPPFLRKIKNYLNLVTLRGKMEI